MQSLIDRSDDETRFSSVTQVGRKCANLWMQVDNERLHNLALLKVVKFLLFNSLYECFIRK